MFEVSIQTTFSAAHRLRHYQGDCEALHGHNWKVAVTMEAAGVNTIGLGIDFRELKQKTSKILSQFDHTCLNELPYFQELNPSSEHIARFLFNELKKEFAAAPVRLKKISVWESENSWVTYYEDTNAPVR
jgi:6-pyruvoyltetrahydropterin/6-carboxytetrahydropterin synthase